MIGNQAARSGISGERPAKTGLILVVDDNAPNRQLVREALQSRGYGVIEAEEGISGFRMAIEKSPDLVLLDIMMPEVDGFQVCAQLKKHPSTQGIPVIFITGLDKMQDVLKGFKMGAADYVVKPLKVAELLARVETHLKIRRLEKERLSSLEARMNAGHWESIQEISEGLSHNFNNILAAAIGNLQYLRSALSDEELIEAADDCMASLMRAKGLVELLQTYQRLEPDFDARGVADVIAHAAEKAKEEVGGQTQVEFDRDSCSLDMTSGCAPYVGQALREIFKNALEAAMKTGGKVKVETCALEYADEGTKRVKVIVKDEGPGLEDEVKSRVFLPFFSTKNTVGVGLGLFSAKIALEQIGGKIEVRPGKEGGAEAEIEFPLN